MPIKAKQWLVAVKRAPSVESGHIAVPRSILYRMSTTNYSARANALQRTWQETGRAAHSLADWLNLKMPPPLGPEL